MSLNTFDFIPPVSPEDPPRFQEKKSPQNSYILVNTKEEQQAEEEQVATHNDKEESSCGMGMNEASYVRS